LNVVFVLTCAAMQGDACLPTPQDAKTILLCPCLVSHSSTGELPLQLLLLKCVVAFVPILSHGVCYSLILILFAFWCRIHLWFR